MIKASVSYELGLQEALTDPAEAVAYLNAALEDGSREVFLMALRDVFDNGRHDRKWDRQLEADSNAGKFNFPINAALAEHRVGEMRNL